MTATSSEGDRASDTNEHVFVSYAQNWEDVVLSRVFSFVERGRYVDVGAADPDHDSVTKAFYDAGWSGIDIEPVEEHADRLRDGRPRDVIVQACAGRESGRATLFEVSDSGLSSLDEGVARAAEIRGHTVREVDVDVVRLDDLLDEHMPDDADVHFLKIDVEGGERDALAGLDLRRWRPWVVVVEATAPNSMEHTHDSWESLLTDNDYVFCLFDGLNRFYLATEHGGLADALSYPASATDQPFISAAHDEALNTLSTTVAAWQALDQEHLQLAELHRHVSDQLDALTKLHSDLDSDHRRLTEIHASSVADLEHLTHLHEQARDDIETLTGDVGRLEVGLFGANERAVHAEETCATLRAGIGRMDDDIRQRTAAIEDLQLELVSVRNDLEQRIDAAVREADQYRLECSQLKESTIWRVTRPLRSLLDLAKQK